MFRLTEIAKISGLIRDEPDRRVSLTIKLNNLILQKCRRSLIDEEIKRVWYSEKHTRDRFVRRQTKEKANRSAIVTLYFDVNGGKFPLGNTIADSRYNGLIIIPFVYPRSECARTGTFAR